MNYLLVGLGGAIGSVLRFSTAEVIARIWTAGVFPYATLMVNVTGCFLIAFIGTLATDRITLTGDVRLFLFTGILGGFTTFSAFGYETFYLFKTSQILLAIVNISANLVLGLGAVVFGYWFGKLFI